jgi:hypothetical protein
MDLSFLDGQVPDPPRKVTVRVVPSQGAAFDGSEFDSIGGILSKKSEPNRHYDFGVVDKKGRRIGMLVTGNSTAYSHQDMGVTVTHERHFVVTKNGESTSSYTFTRWPTYEEAEADVERHIAASAKRYAKTYRGA